MDQRRFLAADEGARPVADLDVEVEAGAQDVLSQQAVFPGLGDGDLEPVDGKRILRPDIDQAMVRVDAVPADHHRFDDGIRIAFHDGPVHEGSRVALVGITHDILVGRVELAGDLPLHAGRETGAAAAAKSGGLDIRQHVQAVPFQTVRQGLVAVTGNVLQDVFRVDETAVPQRDPDLFPVELHVLGIGDVPAGRRILVQEPFHLVAADDVGSDDLFHVIRADRGVESTVRDDLDDGTFFAETETARHQDVHLVGDTVFLEGLPEVLHDFRAFGGLAARASAAQDLQVRGTFVQTAGFLRNGPVPLLPNGQGLGGRPSDALEGIG